MARSCHRIGTNVGFTAKRRKSTLCLSSSGGGLFGRPVTREGLGRFLILGAFFRHPSGLIRTPYRPSASAFFNSDLITTEDQLSAAALASLDVCPGYSAAG
jgi:hypothetical protein